MKGFLTTLFVVCGVIAAAYYCYDPYIKPLLEGSGKKMADDSAAPVEPVTGKETKQGPQTIQKAEPAQPVSYKEKPTDPVEEEKSEIDLFVEERYPMPKILPLEVIVGNWNAVPERAYPAEVTSSAPIAFDLIVNGQVIGSSNVAAGTPLKPLKLVGDQLTVGNAANPGMSRTVPVDTTDFKSRIQQRYDEFVAMKTNQVETARARAKQALEADPNLLAKLTGKGDPAAEAVSPGDPKFSPVKASLKSGEVASVKLEEATDFTWNGSEEIGGEFGGTYETATVRFEIETIFGTFPAVYKCLMQGGRVVAWIDPVTEDRI